MYMLTGVQFNCFMAAEILSDFILKSDLPEDVREACNNAASVCWSKVPEIDDFEEDLE